MRAKLPKLLDSVRPQVVLKLFKSTVEVIRATAGSEDSLEGIEILQIHLRLSLHILLRNQFTVLYLLVQEEADLRAAEALT